jgi:hypothetical protein
MNVFVPPPREDAEVDDHNDHDDDDDGSRRDKKLQRHSFREIFTSVCEDAAPEEIISFRTQSFRLESWAKIKQMEALRDCLQVSRCHYL